MAYATVNDVQARLIATMNADKQRVCGNLLDDVALLIDAYNSEATDAAKKTVSCSAVIRALAATDDSGVPIGASQGSMSAMGYSQTWTMSTGTTGELYLSKSERRLLGLGNRIGSYSPVEELVPCTE